MAKDLRTEAGRRAHEEMLRGGKKVVNARQMLTTYHGQVSVTIYRTLIEYLQYIQCEATNDDRQVALEELQAVITGAKAMHDQGFTDDEWLSDTNYPDVLKTATMAELELMVAMVRLVREDPEYFLSWFVGAMLALEASSNTSVVRDGEFDEKSVSPEASILATDILKSSPSTDDNGMPLWMWVTIGVLAVILYFI